VDWIDQSEGHFWCNYLAGDPYSCGWSMNLGPDRITGLDLSDFDGFNILVHHQGESPRIRPYLRHFDLAYSDVNNFDVSSKVMSTAIRTSDLNQPIFVRLTEFSVAEWWITEFDIAREHYAPSLNNVIVFGFDFNVPGMNEIRIEKIEAVGERIKKETLYFGIIFIWMTVIVLEVLSRFYLARKKSRADDIRIKSLANEYQKLELQKQEFEELSTTDVLTGILNRAGVYQLLRKHYARTDESQHMGLLLVDIDHFKKINDRFGHDVGDIVIKNVTHILSKHIRKSDILGRWGGEEFILLCPEMSADYLPLFAEKLRESIEEYVVEEHTLAITVTISVGATIINPEETFEVAFKRVDTALYQAKNSGRNRVHIESA
jgi:diguanylate cyclase (GGDEF)-like protein